MVLAPEKEVALPMVLAPEEGVTLPMVQKERIELPPHQLSSVFHSQTLHLQQ